MELVHIIVDALIHGLDTAGNGDLTLQFGRLIFADQGFQLFDQILGFAVCDELGGLHGIHQELELRQLKIACTQIIVVVASVRLAYDIQSEMPQFLKIQVESFPVRPDAGIGQEIDDLLHGQHMLIIGFTHENLHQIQEFEFLIACFCHFLIRIRLPRPAPQPHQFCLQCCVLCWEGRL